MGIFTIEPGLAIWTWVTFGLLLLLLAKFVYPTIYRNIKDREEAIEKAVDNASAIEKRLDAIEREHEDMISVARKEADRLLMETRRNAETLKSELSKKAESEAALILEEAKTRIAEDRELAIAAIKKDIVDLVCQGSEKIIGRSFVKDEDRAWAREFVNSYDV